MGDPVVTSNERLVKDSMMFDLMARDGLIVPPPRPTLS